MSLLWFAVLVVFVSAFWSILATQFPEPFNRIAYAYQPLIGEWWQENMLQELTSRDRRIVLWALVSFVFGMLLPAIVLLLSGRRLRDVGFGLPNRLGVRLILVSIGVAIPFGLGLVWSIKMTGQNPIQIRFDLRYMLNLLAMIPEHFLICGVCTALMLPARRLPARVPMAPGEGSWGKRLLRWLGLAQPGVHTSRSEGRGQSPFRHPSSPKPDDAHSPTHSRPGRNGDSPRAHSSILLWFGLTRTSLFAVVMSGMLFGYVHIGKPYPPEVILSFPGGAAVAYVTFRSHSIWPAVLAHWAMNLIPIGLLAVLD